MDLRDSERTNNRYLVNQLLADNGFRDRHIIVMVTDIETLTIHPTSTRASTSTGTGTSSASQTQTQTRPANLPEPELGRLNPLAPFGSLNQSVVLPRGALAPTLDLVFPDPAAIILPNSVAFVESPLSFLHSCRSFVANGHSFENRAARFYNNFGQIARAQLAELRGLRALEVLAGWGNEDSECNGGEFHCWG